MRHLIMHFNHVNVGCLTFNIQLFEHALSCQYNSVGGPLLFLHNRSVSTTYLKVQNIFKILH